MSVPIILTTELTNVCSLECVFCPRKNARNSVGFMKMDLFKKIIDEGLDAGVRRVIFDKDGDPLMSPDVVNCLKYIRSKDPEMYVSFNTPAVFFPADIMRGLLENNLTRIVFSLLAFFPSTYEAVTKHDLYDMAARNIREFLHLKEESGAKTEVILKMVAIDGISETEQNLFKGKWEKWPGVDKVVIDPVFDWHGMYSGKKVPLEFGKYCKEIFMNMVVNYDGRVSLCCLDARKEQIVGDLNKQALLQVWNGPEMTAARACWGRGDTSTLPLCSRCERWRIR